MVCDLEAKSSVCVLKACRRQSRSEERRISTFIIGAPVLMSGAARLCLCGLPDSPDAFCSKGVYIGPCACHVECGCAHDPNVCTYTPLPPRGRTYSFSSPRAGALFLPPRGRTRLRFSSDHDVVTQACWWVSGISPFNTSTLAMLGLPGVASPF